MRSSTLLGMLITSGLFATATIARADIANPSTGGSHGTLVSDAGTSKESADDDGKCAMSRGRHTSGIAIGVVGIALAVGLHQARRRRRS
jgi:hypothetical protein